MNALHPVRIALGLWLVLASWSLAQDVPEVVRTTLEQADRLRQEGRSEEAARLYREVVKQAPTLAAAYVGLGAIEHAAGRPEKALEVFREGLERAPDNRTLLFNASATALQTGKAADALGYVDRALARNDKDAALHNLRGSVLQKLDRTADAAKEFETVVRLEPTNARAHYNLGNVYFRLGKKAEAIEAFTRATREDKALLPAFYNLGAVLYEAKRYEEALKAYEVALAPIDRDLAAGKTVEGSHALAYSNLGAIFSQRQSWDRALDAYRKAETLDAGSAAAAYNTGYILYRMDRLDEAYEAYDRAAKIDPSLPLANLHRGLIDARRGRHDRAVRFLEQAMPKLDDDGRRTAALALAKAQQALGDTTRARAGFEAILASRPDDVEALIGLGRLLREAGQMAEARARLERARKVLLDSSGVALELAALAQAEGDRAKERALYAEVLKREGDRPDLWPVRLSHALLLAVEGAGAAARQDVEALAKKAETLKDPQASKLVHTAYGILLARDGDGDGALREFQAAVRDDRSFAPAQAGLATLAALGGNLDAASSSFAALTAGADFKDVRLLARLNLGKVLWLLGRGAEAKPHLAAALETFPGDATAQLALGEIALGSGDVAGALPRLAAAAERCDPAKAAPVGGSRLLTVSVGNDAVCARAKAVLGHALVGAAVQALDRGGDGGRDARDAAEKALAQPLEPPLRAVALFARGTAHLLLDDVRGARRDLAAALAPELPAGLAAAARNNLGAALLRDGAVPEALKEFEAARGQRGSLAPATLNLAIVLHERPETRDRALALYQEYLAQGGLRKDDAQKWAESLRRVYQ